MNPASSIHPDVWVARQSVHSTERPVYSSGFRLLDAELPGGGWPCGALTELLVRHMGIGELRFLAPTLRHITQSAKHVVLLAPPHVPYAPAFAALGIQTERLLVVHAQKPIDRLWAIEQSIKSNQFGGLITWLDDSGPQSIRRLQLAASRSTAPVFVFRPWSAQKLASPAPLRMLLLPRRYPELAVQVIKRRGPVMAKPIDIAIPIAGVGLRQLDDSEAIVAAAPTQEALSTTNVSQSLQTYAVDRLRHRPTLSSPLSPSSARNGTTARH